MNIALVSDVYLPTVSGVASSTNSIARFLASRGHHVTLICPRPLTSFHHEDIPNLTYVYTPGIGDSLFVNKSFTPFPLGFVTLWRVFRTGRFDIIHFQEPAWLGISSLILGKIFSVPIVGALHFSWAQVERMAPWFVRWISVPFMKAYVFSIYRSVDAIMVPTATSAEALRRLIGRGDRIHPISNGVDTHLFSPVRGGVTTLRKKYHVPSDKPVFLYVGRLDADKNIETVLQALAIMKTPAHFVIAGVGKQEAPLRRLAGALKLSNITWVGGVKQQEMIELYHLSDIFVIMSPVETQSIVALQALACGLPLIAANAGALPELIDGTNGYLIDTYDVEKLASEMERLAADPKRRQRMGGRSREISLMHHKPKVLALLEALYVLIAARKTA